MNALATTPKTQRDVLKRIIAIHLNHISGGHTTYPFKDFDDMVNRLAEKVEMHLTAQPDLDAPVRTTADLARAMMRVISAISTAPNKTLAQHGIRLIVNDEPRDLVDEAILRLYLTGSITRVNKAEVVAGASVSEYDIFTMAKGGAA